MKVINLDKFREFQTVELEGAQYKVFGMTMEEFLEDAIQSRLDALAGDTKGLMREMISIVCEKSDVPREVLVKQPFRVLNAILQVTQGVDPEAEDSGN